jgi:hypothetical protein
MSKMKLPICLITAFAVLLVLCLCSCRKAVATFTNKAIVPATDSTAKKVDAATTFTTYTIRTGGHYCENNSYPSFTAPAIYFTVVFDSSAIYQTSNPNNQYDYNKLYGFSDNNSLHQQFSARFGWRWCNGELELSAYTYNNGVRSDRVLGAVTIGEENKCAIIVSGDHYDFVLNGVTTSVPRESKTTQAVGYKLLPYFGGDEAAPHTVSIKIREDEGL